MRLKVGEILSPVFMGKWVTGEVLSLLLCPSLLSSRARLLPPSHISPFLHPHFVGCF
jgi:hypothetical protein